MYHTVVNSGIHSKISFGIKRYDATDQKFYVNVTNASIQTMVLAIEVILGCRDESFRSVLKAYVTEAGNCVIKGLSLVTQSVKNFQSTSKKQKTLLGVRNFFRYVFKLYKNLVKHLNKT